jgi:hypothetical protein
MNGLVGLAIVLMGVALLLLSNKVDKLDRKLKDLESRPGVDGR